MTTRIKGNTVLDGSNIGMGDSKTSRRVLSCLSIEWRTLGKSRTYHHVTGNIRTVNNSGVVVGALLLVVSTMSHSGKGHRGGINNH
jgi:hypothetical protein